MILHSPYPDDDRVRLLTDLGMPFVLHGRTRSVRPRMPGWTSTIPARSSAPPPTCIDLGHRRIAMISGPKGMTFANHRETGFRAAHHARGLVTNPALIGHTAFTDEMGFRNWPRPCSSALTPPTAFLAGSMMTALGVFRAIRSAGLLLGTRRLDDRP